jgi:hypothetical protein
VGVKDAGELRELSLVGFLALRQWQTRCSFVVRRRIRRSRKAVKAGFEDDKKTF